MGRGSGGRGSLYVIVDILSGALSGAGCSRPDVARIGNGVFILVINPAAFTTLDLFRKQVDDFAAYIKSSPTAPGFKEILTPGEVEVREERRRRVEGVFVEDETWRQITEVAQTYGVPV